MEKKKAIWLVFGVVAGLLIVSWANAMTVSAGPALQIGTPRPTLTPIIEPPSSSGQPARLHGSIFDWGQGFMPAGVNVSLRGDGWEIWSQTDESGQYHFYSVGNEVAVMNVIIPENRPDLRALTLDAPVRVNAAGELIVNLALYPQGLTPDAIVHARMSASTAQAGPGDAVSFEIVVENVWDDGIHQVIVADMLPGGLTYVQASASQGEVVWDRGLLWVTLGSLGAGESATVRVEATVNENALDAAQIINRATVYNSENTAIQTQAALDVLAPAVKAAAEPEEPPVEETVADPDAPPVELLPVTGIKTVLPLAVLALIGLLVGAWYLRKNA